MAIRRRNKRTKPYSHDSDTSPCSSGGTGNVVSLLLTFHPNCHPSELADGHSCLFDATAHHLGGYIGPALVALVTDAITATAISLHRAWIKEEGTKADIDPPRLLVGGQALMHAVRLPAYPAMGARSGA